MANALETLGKRVYRRLKRRRLDGQFDKQRARIEAILARTEMPRPIDDPKEFDRLQAEFPAREPYGYDVYTAWWRGARRSSWLVPLAELQQPGARVLEASCGDGMTGHALAAYGHDVTLHDLEDWRDSRAKGLRFVQGDLTGTLPLESNTFHFVFSYNAFEHIADPAAALKELVRVCRPGGIIHLDFGPLYASPWGLHAYSSVRVPYPQYLFREPLLMRKIEELGLYDLGRERTDLQPLNRWRIAQFERLWHDSGCAVITATTKDESKHLGVVERYPEAFQGLGLTYEDLVAAEAIVTLRKPSQGSQP